MEVLVGPSREYGPPPFPVVVLHGGPGAAGSAAGLARGLSRFVSVLEPMQRADSIAGQIAELHAMLETRAQRPVVLIGWSWGAMLAWMFAATRPADVSKVILVSSAAFDEESAAQIMPTRLGRLEKREREEIAHLTEPLTTESLARLTELLDKADDYAPISEPNERIELDAHIYDRVWSEAVRLRRSGELAAMGNRITCPVIAIHGEHDPHPIDGVARLPNVRVITLPRCGHTPWRERFARDQFFQALQSELE